MDKLINPTLVPPGGFFFRDPDTGFDYNLKYSSFTELEQHVSTYRIQNGLPHIDNFREIWEAYVCANFPVMHSKCCPIGANVKRRFEQYWSGAKSFMRAVVAGKDAFVSQTVADMRAKQCLRCAQNVRNIGHSHAQFYTNRFISRQVGSRRTKMDKELFTCKSCTCIVRSKVWYSDDIISKGLTDTEIGKLTREPRDIKTGKFMQCWQLRAALRKDDK